MNYPVSLRDGRITPDKLNLGFGSRVVEGLTNVDYAVGERITKIPLFRSFNRRIRFFNLDRDECIVVHNFPHKCMYDAESLMKACRDTGFEVGLKAPFQSRIDGIETVEIKDRTEHAVVVEGVNDGGVSFPGGAGHD